MFSIFKKTPANKQSVVLQDLNEEQLTLVSGGTDCSDSSYSSDTASHKHHHKHKHHHHHHHHTYTQNSYSESRMHW